MSAFLSACAGGHGAPAAAAASPEASATPNAREPEARAASEGRPENAAGAATAEAPAFRDLGAAREAISIDSGLTGHDRASYIDANVKSAACADAIVRGQWQQDVREFANPAAHFDNCQIDAGLELLRSAHASAKAAARAGKVPEALSHAGRALHSIEDFYAHTNFVELAAESGGTIGGAPQLTLWKERDPALAPFLAKLVSGTVMWEPGGCPDGTPSHGQLNKDDGSSPRGGAYLSVWKMTHYRAVAELTKAACRRFLKELLNSADFAAVVEECGTTYGFALLGDERKH